MAHTPMVVMMGTDPAGGGGVAAVIRGYLEAGLGTRWPVLVVGTHCEGGAAAKLAAWLGAWLRLAWLLAQRRCGVVHLHAASRMSFWRKWSFFLLARACGVPVIWHIHGGDFERFHSLECGRWRRALIRRALGSGFRVVALSPRWGEVLSKIAPRANVVVIPNGVEVAHAPTGVMRQPSTLLYLGRISRHKGAFDLLPALRQVVEAVPGARLRVAGTGESARFMDCARQLGVGEHVDMLGWIAGPAKQRALAEAGVVVLPSYAEGMPMVLLEAMQRATPVVASTVGGIPDVVREGENGLLVRAGDIDALAGALTRLLTEPALAERLGAAGQRMVERDFSIEASLSRLDGLYVLAGLKRRAAMLIRGNQTFFTKV